MMGSFKFFAIHDSHIIIITIRLRRTVLSHSRAGDEQVADFNWDNPRRKISL